MNLIHRAVACFYNCITYFFDSRLKAASRLPEDECRFIIKTILTLRRFISYLFALLRSFSSRIILRRRI